jgi:hypothetical protein
MTMEQYVNRVMFQTSVYDILATEPDKPTYESLKEQGLERCLPQVWDFDKGKANMPALYMLASECRELLYPTVNEFIKYYDDDKPICFQDMKDRVKSYHPDDDYKTNFFRSFNSLLLDAIITEVSKDSEHPLVSPSHYVLGTALVASRIGSKKLRKEYEWILAKRLDGTTGNERVQAKNYYRALLEYDLSKLDNLIKDEFYWNNERESLTHPVLFEPSYVIHDNTHFTGNIHKEAVKMYVALRKRFEKFGPIVKNVEIS